MHLAPQEAFLFGAGISALSHIVRPMITLLIDQKFRKNHPHIIEKLENTNVQYEELDEYKDKEALKYLNTTGCVEYLVPAIISIVGFLTCVGALATKNPEVLYAASIPTLTHAGEFLFKK
ncbi:MAG: hypothetical protein NUV87_01995 [Candidatus Roizmanbacteria bacterium]|nr:hypothetical protein [Candidatus Roizmanbacteria bacterium]